VSFKSKKLREAARDEACVSCGSIGTTVLAHLPYMGIADGGSSKCDDWVSAFLCDKCHYEADHGERRRDIFWRYQMNVRTLRRMIERQVIRI